jgi:phosphatidylserine/phosphatidylglycerophosphate/cardiolipin synthase-like enzyme
MAVDGAAARALGELSRERWKAACGKTLPAPRADSDPWPEELEPTFEQVDVAIARTRGATAGIAPVREIEALFLDMIAGARSFVYAENQFFASRAIGEAIAKRLAEPDGPEFVLVNPKTTEGWVEQEVMDPARARLMEMIAKCPGRERFRIYTPVSECGDEIYVHAKITIVDDEMLRVGSANFNNRSMGLDSECDLVIGRPGIDPGTARRIAMTRCDLMAEHLGVKAEQVQAKYEETGSLIATVEALRGEGRTLEPFEPEPPNAVETAIADSEALDPESAGEQFEPQARPGLAAGLRAFLGARPTR